MSPATDAHRRRIRRLLRRGRPADDTSTGLRYRAFLEEEFDDLRNAINDLLEDRDALAEEEDEE